MPAPKRAAAKNPAKKPAAAARRHNRFAKIVGFRDKRAPSSAGSVTSPPSVQDSPEFRETLGAGVAGSTQKKGSAAALAGQLDGKTVASAVWETGGVADEYERRNVADERERRDEPVEGAPRGSDPEVHLHTELSEEAKRLATHPREEAHRLSEELKAGEVETTPLIALTGIGIALGFFIALVIALVFVVAYLI